ncbi:hypothetical protein G7L40_20705 [Paenibacillus polymyxa]|uniref:Uncharacterized protein n=1 Tax=Paenibacillus polymyxa TaxID=1406 RepID=A0A378XZA7_PAEPO|nr:MULTISPECIES: hypothetical protein [Paenibacillus]KAF6620589.1 hypothetical protein HFE00_05920 [Paenibacillus sp. EKM101P]KAF6623582.1 hypothetical protein HFE03_08020 [Paenibacillus sp. EKM102P]KAF6633857.1 hypothetical protein HFE01_06495 [Paenibacillus sp. EKM10P]KAF6649382.1 hypothetical protein HFE02_01450 [Paenibacillus sp. EKM11P]KZE68546.1 hypothetical protein AV545_02005 [Paenibacillus jamilae]
MNYGIRDIIELHVFDEAGNFISTINTLKKGSISVANRTIRVKDALLNGDMLKFLNKSEDTKSDYDKFFSKTQNCETIVFNRRVVNCKLIAEGFYRKQENQKDVLVQYEMPKCSIVSAYNFNHSYMGDADDFDYVFEIKEFNEKGDLFKLHIEK